MLTLELRIKHVCGFLYDASESQLVRAYQKVSRKKKDKQDLDENGKLPDNDNVE